MLLNRRNLLYSAGGLAAGLLPAVGLAQTPDSDAFPWPTAGWTIGLPEEHGFPADLVERIEARLRVEAPLLSAFLVVRDGVLVVERYHEAYDPEEPLHVWSVSKSVTNLAVGMALAEELLTGLDQTLGELIPERFPAGVDPRVGTITIEQLLTMTAGWEWYGPGNFARFAETDDLDLMLSRRFQCQPGTCFEYDSGCSNVLSYVVQALSRELMAYYLQPRLFDPLGIERPGWIVTEDGANRGGGGLFLTPREMAKIGLLVLKDGRWDGRRIIGRRWLWLSTHEQSSGVNFSSGTNFGPGPYGYHWWLADSGGYRGYTALGYGGQLIYVVPELEMVIVTAFAEADPTRPDLQQRAMPTIQEQVVPLAER